MPDSVLFSLKNHERSEFIKTTGYQAGFCLQSLVVTGFVSYSNYVNIVSVKSKVSKVTGFKMPHGQVNLSKLKRLQASPYKGFCFFGQAGQVKNMCDWLQVYRSRLQGYRRHL